KAKDERENVLKINKDIREYNKVLRDEIQEQKQKVDKMEHENADIVQRSKYIESNYRRVNEVKEHLEKDNEQLRWVIANLSNPRQPLRNEDYYQRQFDVLNGEVEAWAVVQSKKATVETFTTA